MIGKLEIGTKIIIDWRDDPNSEYPRSRWGNKGIIIDDKPKVSGDWMYIVLEDVRDGFDKEKRYCHVEVKDIRRDIQYYREKRLKQILNNNKDNGNK